jgi:hypothetical protein
MPVDYSQGKIYAIKNRKHKKIFIGATTQTLTSRLCQHRTNYLKNPSNSEAHQLFDKGTPYIQLIKAYPAKSKEDLNEELNRVKDEYKNDLLDEPNTTLKPPRMKREKSTKAKTSPHPLDLIVIHTDDENEPETPTNEVPALPLPEFDD